MHRSPTFALLAVVAVLATVAACAEPAPAPAPAPVPAWGPCRTTPGAATNPRQECATIEVPLDHAQPAGPRITLALSRIRSTRPGSRRGVLLIIPGGPGSSGLSRPASYLPRLPQGVLDRYDVVGFDPRGLGASTPVSCELVGDDVLPSVLKPWPAPDGDIGENLARARRVADACARHGGSLLASISTRTEARDIDRIRVALGEQRISYWGISYGTYVGAVYATMFPDRADRVVLDSSGDPNPALVARGWAVNYGVSIEDRFPDFAAWAAARDGEYGLGADPGAVRETFLRLAADLDRRPLAWPGARPAQLSGNGLRDVMMSALYADTGFTRLASLMRAALRREALLPPEPLPPTPALQNSVAVMAATICNDVDWPGAPPDRAEVARNRAAYPLTAGMPVNVFACAFWTGRPTEPATRISPDGPSPVLLVQNLRDPSTPHSGALRMREALGARARMVTVDSGGHGAYLANGNPCGDRVVTAFLTDGVRPEGDIVCPAERPPAAPHR